MRDYSNKVWGLVWGVSVAIVGLLISNVLTLIDSFFNLLFNILIWVFLFPLKILEVITKYTGLQNKYLLLGVAGVIGFLVWPFAYRVFKFIFSIFKRSPM